jgi:hypothetical protein
MIHMQMYIRIVFWAGLVIAVTSYRHLWGASASGTGRLFQDFAPCTTMVEPAFRPRSGVSRPREWWDFMGRKGVP